MNSPEKPPADLHSQVSRDFGFDKMQAMAEESLQQLPYLPSEGKERRKPTELEVRIFLVGCVPVWLSGALVHYLARSDEHSYLLSDWLFETALHSVGLMNVVFGGAGVLVGVALMKLVFWRLPDTRTVSGRD